MKTDFFTHTEDDIEIQRQRLAWLIGLRWYGATSVIAATFIGIYVLGLHLPLIPLLVTAGVMYGYNYYYRQKVKSPSFNTNIALHQIIFDTLALTVVLILSGGFLNPFFTFYFFIVILSAIMLSPKESIFIIALIAVCFASQGLSTYIVQVDMELSEEGWLYLGKLPFHVVGAPISFVLTALITAYFTQVIMGNLRKREKEVRIARQQAELELSKLDNLLDRVDAGMLVFDRLGYVERVNDRMISWFGSEGSQEASACYVIGKFGKTVHQSPQDFISECESRHYFETRLPTKNDGIRDFEIMVSPILDNTGAMVQRIELILDVTEQKKSQKQWAQAQKLAAIGQLAAGVAHEINTPLGTISILTGEAKAIVSEFEIHDTTAQHDLEDALETIHGQVRRCKDITQGLLNFSRKSEELIRDTNINELAHRSIELARHRTTGISMQEEFDLDLPVITTDVHAIERVIFNLILNAADALDLIDDGKMITVNTIQHNHEIGIKVIDNGIGIKPEDLPHITEPFYTTKAVGKGTGLGLYVAYGIVKELGGRLEFESEPGVGTTATIWLPINHD